MFRDAKTDRFANLPLFARCTPDELRTINRTCEVLHVPAGAILSSPSHRPNPLILVLDGEVQCLGDDGMSELLDGSLHGAAEELTGAPRPDVVMASTDAVVLVLDPRRLVPLLGDCPGFALSLLRHLARDRAAA